MKPSEAIRPISYLKAHAAQVIREVDRSRSPVFVTQNGEAKAVLQDVRTYEEQQESLALLKIIAQSRKSLDAGEEIPLDDAFRQVRERVRQPPPR